MNSEEFTRRTQLETLDHDVCLAVLPPQGGRQRSLTCQLVPTGEQLTEAIESAAPASDGRLAFSVATSGKSPITLGTEAAAKIFVEPV